jgi:xanthine/CO dehydrogenase XdhC/CoxF family maturation factor
VFNEQDAEPEISMSTRQMIQLWRHARQVEEPFYLATVVYVEGSAYAKPGSRMLVTASGRRCGMISGGCLEADIVRRIAWLTANGPYIKTYRSQFEDDEPDVGGTGCGGTVWIMLQLFRQTDFSFVSVDNSASHSSP